MKTEWQIEERFEIAFYLGAMYSKNVVKDHCQSITEFARLIYAIHADFVESTDDYVATFLENTITQDYINRKEIECEIHD